MTSERTFWLGAETEGCTGYCVSALGLIRASQPRPDLADRLPLGEAMTLLERLRPRNWLDGFGLSLQIVSVVGLIELILHYPPPDSSDGWV